MNEVTNEIKVAEVKTTSNHGMFKHLIGNRPVKEYKVQKIIDSIRKHGVIIHPIIVNKELQVIDGQHRLEAFRRLGIPVYYIIDENADYKTCIAMNASQNPWELTDYIYGSSDLGYEDYVALKDTYVTFSALSITVILGIISRKTDGVARSRKIADDVRNGYFAFPFEMQDELIEELNYVTQFVVLKKQMHGRSDIFFNCLAACYECQFIDNARLAEKLLNYPERFGAFNTTDECLKRLEEIYNFQNRSNKVYLRYEVTKMLDDLAKVARKKENEAKKEVFANV